MNVLKTCFWFFKKLHPGFYCEDQDDLENMCSNIPGDAQLHTLLRLDAAPEDCPLRLEAMCNVVRVLSVVCNKVFYPLTAVEVHSLLPTTAATENAKAHFRTWTHAPTILTCCSATRLALTS